MRNGMRCLKKSQKELKSDSWIGSATNLGWWWKRTHEVREKRIKIMTEYKKPELEMMFKVLDSMYNNCEMVNPWNKLYSCTAWVTDELYMGEHVDVLRSYDTIVAIYIPSTQKVYVRGFYSNTTAQHCAKFSRWCREKYGKYSSGEKLSAIGERIRVDKMK